MICNFFHTLSPNIYLLFHGIIIFTGHYLHFPKLYLGKKILFLLASLIKMIFFKNCPVMFSIDLARDQLHVKKLFCHDLLKIRNFFFLQKMIYKN